MTHDTKIGIIIRDDLADWQKLNVTAFLASGITGGNPAMVGEPYEDASGVQYLPLFKQPVFVYEADNERLQRTRTRALSRDVMPALYTKDMFATNNDADNRATVQAVASDDLDIAGLAIRTDNKTFDKIVHGLKLHA